MRFLSTVVSRVGGQRHDEVIFTEPVGPGAGPAEESIREPIMKIIL